MLKKALIYLGLGPDEEYEPYDEFAPASGGEEDRPAVRAVEPAASRPASSTVRPVPAGPGSSSVRPVPADGKREGTGPGGGGVTRPAAEASAVRIVETTTAKPHPMSPTSFNDAQSIGDRFKGGQPVIVNLQGVERDLRRRLVDFASGLCYALGGKMDRVADQVYLLTPADVEVSSDDTRRALD